MIQDEVKQLYKKIQNLLIALIPENWTGIYLYASMINEKKGEMYFYYTPKRIIKTKPINCYEIPEKFGIDENKYNSKIKNLYDYIKKLNCNIIEKWTNITIIIEKDIFTIEYHYNNLQCSRYNDEQRRIVWSYKYLNMPLESLNIRNRMLVKSYKEESKIRPMVYTESIKRNKKDGDVQNENKGKNIVYNENTENRIKNQILKC